MKLDFWRREKRALTLRDPDGWRDAGLLGTRTAAGVVVGPESALGHPAVLGAVRLLAELTASLPLLVYERWPDGRRRAEQHPVYRLLHDVPNDLMTAYQLKETLTLHLLTHGNAYLQVVRQGGRPAALWPLHPTRVSLDLRRQPVVYKVSAADGRTVELAPADVVHVAILSDDGITGRSPVQLAREAIGAALAAEEFAAEYFANAGSPSGVLVTPGTLSKEAYERLKASWNQAQAREGKRHGTPILEQGTEFKPVSSTAEAAQLVESRKLALRLIAAALRIPPHLLDPEARGTYANVETQSLEFLTFSLQPMLARIEEALSRKLFAPDEQGRFFCEFLTDGLLRADTATRYGAYRTGIEAGFLTVAEVRARENLPALPGGAGERHARGAPETRALHPQDALQAELEREFRAVFGRIIERESREVLAVVESLAGARFDPSVLAEKIRALYAEARWMADELLAPIRLAATGAAKLSFQDAIRALNLGLYFSENGKKWLADPAQVDAAAERVAARMLADAIRHHSSVSEAQLLAAARSASSDGELVEIVERLVAEWAEVRPGKASELLATMVRNDVALEVYRGAGASKIRWRANEGACEFCRGLDGKTVLIGEPFVAIGETLAGPGGRMDRPMKARYPRIRPPVHLGCKCSVEIAG